MNYIDLFSGIGGFALGAYWAGLRFEKHYFSEIDPYCVELYQKRFPDAIPLGDIREVDCEVLANTEHNGLLTAHGEGETVEPQEQTRKNSIGKSERGSGVSWLITGGFPCQDISVAGKGAGIRGSRSGLWFEAWRIIRDLRPCYAIIENVGAITRRGLDAVLGSLAEIGYDAEWQDIRASDLGAPHRRERIWIVAYPSATGTGNYTGAIADERWRTGKSGGEGVRQGNRTGLPSRSIATGQDVADTKGNSNRGVMGNNNEQTRKNWSRTHEHISSSNPRRTSDWWAVEPDVGRLAHGIPHRVDRLKGLGNAIVPQIAELLFRQIAQIEEPPEGGEGKK